MSSPLNESPHLRSLSEDLRAKALEYATALGARGPRPTTVLGTAVTLAKEWQSGRLPSEGEGDRGVALLVQPRAGRWVIRRANAAEPTHIFSVRDDAVRRAQALAVVALAPVFVFGPGGTLLERYAAPTGASLPQLAPRPAPRPALPPSRATSYPRPVIAPPEEVFAAMIPEPVVLPEEPVQTLAIAPEYVAVAKNGRRWEVQAPNGTTESFTTKKRATKAASELAATLGLTVTGL